MCSRVSFIVRALVIAAAGFALLVVGLSQANAVGAGVAAGQVVAGQVVAGQVVALTEPGQEGPIIQATERISIPFGFSAGLPLSNDGASVVALGEGGCTDGETITIAFTITQASSGGTVTGLWNGDCSGELQTWTNVATATPSPNFSAGPAVACAFAETFADGSVTDTQVWCDDVVLTSPRNFLPIIRKP